MSDGQVGGVRDDDPGLSLVDPTGRQCFQHLGETDEKIEGQVQFGFGAQPDTPRQAFRLSDLGGVWTGDELILWGGYATYGNGEASGVGARYDPASDTWTVIADSPLSARCDHGLTWTGEVAIVFGGIKTCGHPNFIPSGDAAVYDPSEDAWQVLGDG
ncbi:MAG: hypothetical protein ACLGHX_10550 [Acidimicrobiia bacterium]